MGFQPSMRICLLAAALLAGRATAARSGGEYLVLEAADPAGDRGCALQSDVPAGAGDIRGARLILRRIPIPRGERTARTRPDLVYVPVELTVTIDRELKGGEVQLCIFCHLPPLHIEHIITRDSLSLSPAGEETTVLLATRSEASLFTGMETAWDEEIIAFQESESYRGCYFGAGPEERAAALEQAARFSIHSGDSYLFPPSPSFYWRRIPPLSVSTSLEIRELNGLTAGPLRSLISDTLKTTWGKADGRQVFN